VNLENSPDNHYQRITKKHEHKKSNGRSKEQVEYERQKSECTFKPNIERKKPTASTVSLVEKPIGLQS